MSSLPRLEEALAQNQDDLIAKLIVLFEPCREKDWLWPGIDFVCAIA